MKKAKGAREVVEKRKGRNVGATANKCAGRQGTERAKKKGVEEKNARKKVQGPEARSRDGNGDKRQEMRHVEFIPRTRI